MLARWSPVYADNFSVRSRTETGFSQGRSLLSHGALVTCSLALASVPIFSSSEAWSIVPQVLGSLGTGLVMLTLLRKTPPLHISIWAYAALVICWAFTLFSEPEVWPDYLSLVKVCLLAIACHLIFRSHRQILLLFGMYCASGPITLLMNWEQLRALGVSFSQGQVLEETERFAGTFGNANSAGMYGIILMWSAVSVLVGAGRWWRWGIAVPGCLSGFAICFFSGSRKAMLALGLLLLLIPWVASRGRPGQTRKAGLLLLGIVLIALGGWLASSLPFVGRLIAPVLGGAGVDSSTEQRVAMLIQAFDLWQQFPLFGCGFEGFSRLSEFGVYSHTTFSEVLCNGGLLGFSLILVFYAVPLFQLLRLVKQGTTPESAPIAAALLGFCGLFALFSCFSVLLDSRELVPLYAAVCGVLQSTRCQVWEPSLRRLATALGPLPRGPA